jgi:hypothetical protein
VGAPTAKQAQTSVASKRLTCDASAELTVGFRLQW